jgi:NAD-dependent deacetylase
VRPSVPVYIIDPTPINAGGRNITQIQKGASAGMAELSALLMK